MFEEECKIKCLDIGNLENTMFSMWNYNMKVRIGKTPNSFLIFHNIKLIFKENLLILTSQAIYPNLIESFCESYWFWDHYLNMMWTINYGYSNLITEVLSKKSLCSKGIEHFSVI